MLKIQEVGAVLVELRNKAIAAVARDQFYLNGCFVEASHVVRISTHCIKHLAKGNVRGFVSYLQFQSGPRTDEFDYIVSELFEKLKVVGTCDNGYGTLLPCWEDFQEQFLTT